MTPFGLLLKEDKKVQKHIFEKVVSGSMREPTSDYDMTNKERVKQDATRFEATLRQQISDLKARYGI